ncbi:organic cation transporter protein-like isoform X2 [Cotesia typhae]|uniref:organic cation transporter protein-like isoform X2 n=1 Tax=Cotesia typhae TaxID=2053667 RepID=UPI003D697781
MYDYNYTHLVHLGYENVGKHVEDFIFNTSLVPCSSFVFDKSGKSTIVNEWSLICDRQFYRASTYLIYTFGKLLGLGGLGVFADKYGRKKALIIGLFLQMIATPVISVVPWFWAYLLCKLLTGISVATMFSSGYTISRFVDESPRWLITQNRLEEAQAIIEKYRKKTILPGLLTESLPLKSLSMKQSVVTEEKSQKSCMERYLGNIGIFLADPIFRKKILIMYFSFFVCLMTSFYLVFSVDNET